MTDLQIVALVLVLIPVAIAILIQIRDWLKETEENNRQYQERIAKEKEQK